MDQLVRIMPCLDMQNGRVVKSECPLLRTFKNISRCHG